MRAHLHSAEVLLDDALEVIFKALDAAVLQEKLQQKGREGTIYREMCALVSDPVNWRAAHGAADGC